MPFLGNRFSCYSISIVSVALKNRLLCTYLLASKQKIRQNLILKRNPIMKMN